MKPGRPLMYETPEEMQEAIDEYFNSKKPEFMCNDIKGYPIYKLNPPTLTGLSLHLGFASRQSYYDYENRKDFSYTMKRARLYCENYIEEALYSGDIPPSAGIFALKNFGWSDKQEVEHSGNLPLQIIIQGVEPENTDSE